MDDIKEIKTDIKEIRIEVSKMSAVLEKNTAILDIHIHRTELNETRIQKLEYWLLGTLGAIVLSILVKGLF